MSVDGHEPRGRRGSAPPSSVGRPKGYKHVFVSRGQGNNRPCASCWGVQKAKNVMVEDKEGKLKKMVQKQAVQMGLVPTTTFLCQGCNASVCPKCQDSWKHHDTEQLDSRRKKVEVKVKVTVAVW